MQTIRNRFYSSEQLFEIKRQARIELARRYAKKKDILNWGKMLFPEKFALPFCQELHGYFVEIRNEEFTDTEAPRNHAKTTIKCFLIPIFQALEEPETYQHYLNVQATMPKAITVNNAIKTEIENNEELREIYGNQVGTKWNEMQFELANGVVFTAIGAGQSIRGLNYKNKRPDYIMVDDLYDEEDINNPDQTIKKNEWFWGSLYPARARSKKCSFHMQGTAINNEDLLEKLKKQVGWKSKTFQAIKDWDTKDVLWKELNTFDELMQDMENMGSIIFAREMQNERRDETSAIIKNSWLKNWEYDPVEVKFDKDYILEAVVIGCDPSIGEKNENDATGVALVYKTRVKDGDGHDYWIDDLRNDRVSLDKRIKLLQDVALRAKGLTQVRIEGIGGFKDFVAEVRRRTDLPVHEIDNVKDKISTLESKSHNFENGKVHLNKNIDQKMKDLIRSQLTTNHPKHDDLRDAVLLCIDSRNRTPEVIVF